MTVSSDDGDHLGQIPLGGDEETSPPRSSGPSDEEIRAAAAIAGDYRASVPGTEPDRSPAGKDEGRVADRPSMDFWEVLYERRTTRRFDKSRSVPRDVVLELLDAAVFSPTSCNLQMWDFLVVDDPDLREQLGRLSLQVLSTPLTIFVTYGKEYSEEGYANVQSAAAAMMNMSNAAHVLGMGTFWINQLGPRDEVGRILGIPSDREVICALAVGWPEVYPTKAPRRRPFDHVVHWNRYGGVAIPTSPSPQDWSLDQIREYQQARVLNGNRYNKTRPWEMAGNLTAGERLSALDENGSPDEGSPRWLDVLPVTGLFTGPLARQHRGHRWTVLELSEDVAAFAAKRCPTQVMCDTLVFDPQSVDALPEEVFDRMTLFHRLESLPEQTRSHLLGALHRMLAPEGRFLLKYTSRRSFHAVAAWLHHRRGGPGGVEYVLSPDPNLGPFEALSPSEVKALVEEAGFTVERSFGDARGPSREEMEFRTRNMSRWKSGIVRIGLALWGVLLCCIPGASRYWARDRALLLRRG
ncbi:MAG: nitroreductase family protein [Planctomycetota bacterium]|nr:nitroreductase family protein [Planctomycetota bacterium]